MKFETPVHMRQELRFTHNPLLQNPCLLSFGDLRHSMINDYVAVSCKTNPVVVKLATMLIESVRYVVEQYSLFPQRIVSYLYAARAAARVSGWTAVDSELTRAR